MSTMKEIIRSVLDAELTGQAYAVRESPRAPRALTRQRRLMYRGRLARSQIDMAQTQTKNIADNIRNRLKGARVFHGHRALFRCKLTVEPPLLGQPRPPPQQAPR